jgi:predicted DCC family thiol-disulfide oxidoreductase YuxK
MLSRVNTIFYDSKCTMCSRFKVGLEKLDRNNNFYFISIHSCEFKKYSLNYNECSQEIHLLTFENEVLKGKDVVEYIISVLPIASKLKWLLNKESSTHAIDSFYQFINKKRKKTYKTCGSCS